MKNECSSLTVLCPQNLLLEFHFTWFKFFHLLSRLLKQTFVSLISISIWINNDRGIIKVGIPNAYSLSVTWSVVQQITWESVVSFHHQKRVISGCSFISAVANLFLNCWKRGERGSVCPLSLLLCQQQHSPSCAGSCTGERLWLTAEAHNHTCWHKAWRRDRWGGGKEGLSLSVAFQSSTRWSWPWNYILTVAASILFLFRPQFVRWLLLQQVRKKEETYRCV